MNWDWDWRSLVFNCLKHLISRQFPTVCWITPEELANWLKNSAKPQPILLDARSEVEYAVSHLQGARRIDVNSNLAALTDISKEAAIVVYCSVGYRSAVVVDRLARAGYFQVYNLEGSIFQWVNEGRPVFQDNPTKLVHHYNWFWGKLLKQLPVIPNKITSPPS